MSQIFDFTEKKISGFSVKIGCSGILSCAILTEVNDEKGQNTDFPKAKRLYYNIHKLFWEFNAFGPQFSMIRVSDPQKMAKMENKLSRDHFWSNIQF